MADGTGETILDEILSKLTSLQEKYTLLINKQNKNIESFRNSMTDFKIGLQPWDTKVEQDIRRPQQHPIENQSSFPANPNFKPPWNPNYSDFPVQLKSMRLDVPRFSGENSSAWISCIQRYFDFYNVSDSQRLKSAYFHLDGDALNWYDLMSRNQFIPTWKEFLLALENRFGLSEFEGSFDELSELFQEDGKGDTSIEANNQDSPCFGREEQEHIVAISEIDEINSSGWKHRARSWIQTTTDSTILYNCIKVPKFNWAGVIPKKILYINWERLIEEWIKKCSGSEATSPYELLNFTRLQLTMFRMDMEAFVFLIRMGNLLLKDLMGYFRGGPNNKIGRRKRKCGPITLMIAIGLSDIFNELIIVSCSLFWTRIPQRLTCIIGQEASELKKIMENLVMNLLPILNFPEYPALVTILDVLCVLLLHNAGLKSYDITAGIMVFNLLDKIGARLTHDVVLCWNEQFWILQEFIDGCQRSFHVDYMEDMENVELVGHHIVSRSDDDLKYFEKVINDEVTSITGPCLQEFLQILVEEQLGLQTHSFTQESVPAFFFIWTWASDSRRSYLQATNKCN